MNSLRRIAVVTGGNRGIGLATCRLLSRQGLQVVLTGRDKILVEDAVHQLSVEGLDVTPGILDVASRSSRQQFVGFVQDSFPRVDVLVNNAAVMLDIAYEGHQTRVASAFEVSLESVRSSLEVNTLGPFELIRMLSPAMVRNRYGRIVNVSSGLGQISSAGAKWPGYRMSKIALNGMTKIFADELKGTNVLVNAASPGWVRTRMGGDNATRSPEEAADTIAWLATLPDDGPTGGFFDARQPIAW